MTWLSEHWLDLFGWIGSALLIFSLLQTRVLRFRLLNLAASVILVIFNALLAVWPMVGMNVATSAINISFIARMLRDRHSETAYHDNDVIMSRVSSMAESLKGTGSGPASREKVKT